MPTNLYTVLYLKEKNAFQLYEHATFAYLYYRDFKINLLTGEKSESNLALIKQRLAGHRLQSQSSSPIVFHLFYELGLEFENLDFLIPAYAPLCVEIHYSQIRRAKQISHAVVKKVKFEATEMPSFEHYEEQFKIIQDSLHKGDCYQVNYTSPFYFRYQDDLSAEDFLTMLWKNKSLCSSYAHATYIGVLNRLYLSNSPECLFQIHQRNKASYLVSMPIKGTLAIKSSIEEAWENLQKSSKDEAELDMITDLVRNDLTKIDLRAATVYARKLRLLVPGLVHQYSLVGKKLTSDLDYLQVLLAIFPGGSITGAPKKRVMQIISQLEKAERSFYCGSTLVLDGALRACSINIRSCEINLDDKELVYHAGGGITIKSDAKSEYEEMLHKVKSFPLWDF